MSLFGRLFGKTKPQETEQDRFAGQVIQALQAHAAGIRVEYDREGFELRHLDENARGQRTFLYNSFVEHQRLSDEERHDHLARLVGFIVESYEAQPQGEAALDMLLPVLRSRADIVAVSCQTGDFPYQSASRPFCDSMLLMLAIDSATSISLVTDKTLDALGISFDDALGIAIGHLDERGGHSFGQLGEGTFVSTCGDYYDASRLLLPELLTQLPLKGNPVAIAEARSALLVTGSEDMEGLAIIAQCALDDFPENERAVSLTPIEWRDGAWGALGIEDRHPQQLKNLRAHQLGWTYGATGGMLQKQLGDDIFVANVLLVEQDGKASTAATWATGVRTACPLVEALMIQEDGAFPGIRRSLDDVVSACGPFPEIETMPYPRRWLLPSQIPDAARRDLTDNYPDHAFFAG